MSKKICIVSSQYLPHVGGVENYVFNLSRELERQGHEVTILTSQMDGAPNYEKNGAIEIYRLPTRQFMGGRFPVLKKNKELRAFTKEFKERHFDLMIINMYQKYYIAFAKLENDNISDVTMISDATLVYDKDGIIFESELFEEALKAYDIVKKVYTGSDEVFFFTEILDEDILGDDIFICNDIIDRFRVM